MSETTTHDLPSKRKRIQLLSLRLNGSPIDRKINKQTKLITPLEAGCSSPATSEFRTGNGFPGNDQLSTGSPIKDDKRIKIFWFDSTFNGSNYRWVHLKRCGKEMSFSVKDIPYIISRLTNIYKSCEFTENHILKEKLEECLKEL